MPIPHPAPLSSGAEAGNRCAPSLVRSLEALAALAVENVEELTSVCRRRAEGTAWQIALLGHPTLEDPSEALKTVATLGSMVAAAAEASMVAIAAVAAVAESAAAAAVLEEGEPELFSSN